MWEWLRGLFKRMFNQEVKREFQVEIDNRMLPEILKYEAISAGVPPWQTEELKSVGLAGFINDFIARLVTLDVKISCPESPRGLWMQDKADYVLEVLQEKVSDAIGGCGLMFKPNGTDVDYVKPSDFVPTEFDSNGNILGAVFQSQLKKGKKTYTRLEYHRFDGDLYRISNACYVSDGVGIGKRCSLTEVEEWSDILEEAEVEGIEYPLFSYFKVPNPNRIADSPLGLPIWANCIKELEDFDVAWNRKADEVYDSTHVTFVPDTAVSYVNKEGEKPVMPRYVKGIYTGDPMDTQITEHVPTLLTEQRISDLNSILSVIGMKCGLNAGTFVFNENTGLKTATEIEADQQETIRTVERIRVQLVKSLNRLFYALNVMADVDTVLAVEPGMLDEIVFDFGDITYNYEEDKSNWWKYRLQGDVPSWMYFVRFEGMTEDEAKKMVEEAKPDTPEFDDFFRGV